jgi:hypothetical protein
MPLVDINSSLSVREVDYIITRSGISSQNYYPWNPPEFNKRSCYSYVFVDEAEAETKENDLMWVQK